MTRFPSRLGRHALRALLAAALLSLAPASQAGAQSNPCNPGADANPCNPCGDGANPCNPCTDNPCADE
jgi:hypothetical protein